MLETLAFTSGSIHILDPPCDKLAASPSSPVLIMACPSGCLTEDSPLLFDTHSDISKPNVHFDSLNGSSYLTTLPVELEQLDMTRKRRSLQNLFIPTIRQTLLGSNNPSDDENDQRQGLRMRSQSLAEHSVYDHPSIPAMSQPATPLTSPTTESPPNFLLDDDPFANHTARVSPYAPAPTPAPTPTPSRSSTSLAMRQPEPVIRPRSPLTISVADNKPVSSFQPTSPLRPNPNGHFPILSPRVTPASLRPAFKPRPSLPSLDTLARMNVVIPKKVRKGRVGAGLPFEPWDMDSDQSACSSPGLPSLDHPVQQPTLSSSSQSHQPHQYMQPEPRPRSIIQPRPGSPNFVSDLELDFMDVSDESEEETLHPSSASRYQDNEDDTLRFGSESELCSSLDWSRTPSSSSQPSLTRSTSFASTYSFSGSSATFRSSQPSAALRDLVQQDSHAESETDFSSPPSDYFSYNRSSSPQFTELQWGKDNFQLPAYNGPFTTKEFFSDSRYSDEPESLYQPGTSAGTIRSAKPFSHEKRMTSEEEPVDGGERQTNPGEGGHGGSRSGNYGSTSHWSGSNSGRNQGASRSGGQQGSGRGNGDDGRDNRRPGGPPVFPQTSTDEATSSDEESPDEFGRSAPAPARKSAFRAPAVSGSDDDVPLAQRIPTALDAQKTIRRQVREERDQRRKERALRAAAAGVVQQDVTSASSRSRNTTLRPGAGGAVPPPVLPNPQDVSTSRTARRPRTQTMPSSTPRPFAPEDLVKKLQNVQVAESGSSSHQLQRAPSSSSRDMPDHPRPPGRLVRDRGHSHQHQLSANVAETSRPLRRAKSIQRPDDRTSHAFGGALPPMPSQAVDFPAPKIGRSLTTTNRPKPQDPSAAGAKPRSVPGNSFADSFNIFRSSGDGHNKLHKEPATRSARTSSEQERPARADHPRPPMPPLPAQGLSPGKAQKQQQRIFIGDMQRFNTVELSPTTTAADVIEIVEAQGSLKGWVGVGGWMLFEVAQDFGMERPIRNYELLADVQASWNKDKMVNTFMIKLTPLATPLSQSAIPSSSPIHTGFVEWESKRGKWSKRYMQLREHSIWLSKREGKDETFLCSLSNFDAYFVTRLHKAPRQFVFAVKSTDNLSYFENSADYLHIFSCNGREGEAWVEKILLARSYVLHQEKNILFKSQTPAAPFSSTSLSHAGTRKGTRSVQPLVSLPANPAVAPVIHTNVFEPGSLLAKHA